MLTGVLPKCRSRGTWLTFSIGRSFAQHQRQLLQQLLRTADVEPCEQLGPIRNTPAIPSPQIKKAIGIPWELVLLRQCVIQFQMKLAVEVFNVLFIVSLDAQKSFLIKEKAGVPHRRQSRQRSTLQRVGMGQPSLRKIALDLRIQLTQDLNILCGITNLLLSQLTAPVRPLLRLVQINVQIPLS